MWGEEMSKQPPAWILRQFPLFIRKYIVRPQTYVFEGGVADAGAIEERLFMFVGFKRHCKWCGQRVPTYVEVGVTNG